MSKETVIKRINEKHDKPKIVREQARKCIENRVQIKDVDGNLSQQMFDNAPTLYLNPTEKIFVSNLVVPNETFATVLASGDFAIEGSFHGAREILTFDINKNQYYPAALKIKGLQNMEYEEYYGFFSDPSSPYHLSPEIYEKLKSSSTMDYDLYAFIDEIIKLRAKEKAYTDEFVRRIQMQIPGIANVLKQANPEEVDEVLKQIQGYNPSAVLRTISGTAGFKNEGTYLESEDSYKKAQESIKDTRISHVRTDIAGLKTSLDKYKYTKKQGFNGFSGIYLSNIPEYIPGETFTNIVTDQLMPLLSENGVIGYCAQGTSVQTLTMPKRNIEVLEQNQECMKINQFNPLAGRQMLNAAKGVSLLSEQYDVSFTETDTLSLGNGTEDKDTYVEIRKKTR